MSRNEGARVGQQQPGRPARGQPDAIGLDDERLHPRQGAGDRRGAAGQARSDDDDFRVVFAPQPGKTRAASRRERRQSTGTARSASASVSRHSLVLPARPGECSRPRLRPRLVKFVLRPACVSSFGSSSLPRSGWPSRWPEARTGRARSCAPACRSSPAAIRVRGLQSAVTVERDALGIPTIRGISREDVARATGFVHAQDRFFQMDLARRRAAGELAALVGDVGACGSTARCGCTGSATRRGGRWRCCRRAIAPCSRPTPPGSTAGSRRWARSPFEYLILRQTPQPWLAEDSLLVVLSMFVTLQDPDGAYESMLATMHDVLPPEMFDLLAPRGTEWDSPMRRRAVHDRRRARARGLQPARASATGVPRSISASGARLPRRTAEESPWAAGAGRRRARQQQLGGVAPAHAPTARALVANDMHLDIRVPNTWYRAVIEWRDEADSSQTRLLEGHHAARPPDARGRQQHPHRVGLHQRAGRQRRPRPARARSDGPQPVLDAVGLARLRALHGNDRGVGRQPVSLDVRWTIWGPVLGHRSQGPAARLRLGGAFRRAAQQPRCCRSRRPARWKRRSTPRTSLGTPAQNMVVADRSGRIALDHLRIAAAPHRPRRHAAGIVGRRLARLERLARRRPNIRASSIRRADACGRPTRASWTAACCARSATATTTSGRAPARSAIGCASASSSRPATCWTSSSTRASTFLSRWRDSDPAPPDAGQHRRRRRRAPASATSSRRTGPARRRRIRPRIG